MSGNSLFQTMELTVSLAGTVGLAPETDSFALETSGLVGEPLVPSAGTNLLWVLPLMANPSENGESMANQKGIRHRLFIRVSMQ